MSEVIAERRFATRSGALVAARIYAPEKMQQSSEWSCRIEIEGPGSRSGERVIGVDSFQALELGLHLVCAHVDKIAATLSFQGGPEGDVGTPLMVTWSYSPALKEELYRLIEERITEELDAGEEESARMGR
jgi:hypothetical protein